MKKPNATLHFAGKDKPAYHYPDKGLPGIGNKTEIMKEVPLSTRLSDLRKAAKLSHKDVSDYVGKKIKTYQAYEDGRAEPSINTFLKLSKLYGMTVDELINGRMPERSTELQQNYYSLSLEKRKIVDFILNLQ